jgi:hypothetical protein
MMDKKRVYVYYLEIKNKETNTFLTTSEIKTSLKTISDFEYSRNRTTSMLRNLNGVWFAVDIINHDIDLRIKGSRIRNENLPTVRFSKERWEPLKKPDGSDLLETSFGKFYFPESLTRGCFLFLLKNHHGMSVTRILDYIRNVFPQYRPVKTVITRDSDFSNFIKTLKELRYVTIDNKRILPAKNEGVGTYHDRITHQDDVNSIYNVKRMTIDVRNQKMSITETLKRLAQDFGFTTETDEEFKQFIADSNLHLTAVSQGSKRQDETDLTKSLYAFDYKSKPKFNENDFYDFCDKQFNNALIMDELIRLARGIDRRISNVNDNE